MASKELDIFRQAQGKALAAVGSAQQTREEIKKEREATEREVDEMANTHINLIFALDATASRERFWEESKLIQSFMFSAVNASGLNLRAQIVSYSGLTNSGDVAAGNWHNNAFSLNEAIGDIHCVAGGTQIGQVFQHALRENAKRKVHGVILVGDSCEENGEDLKRLAAELRKNGISLFIMDDADRSTMRHPDTLRIFRTAAEVAEGVYLPFDQKNIPALIEYLKVAAVTSSGNKRAIDRISGTIVTPQGRAFLEQRKRLLLTYDKT